MKRHKVGLTSTLQMWMIVFIQGQKAELEQGIKQQFWIGIQPTTVVYHLPQAISNPLKHLQVEVKRRRRN